jgi:hypothetical protein
VCVQTRGGSGSLYQLEHNDELPCRIWDLRIERVIMSRFADPQFRAAHGKGRDYDDPTNFFGSPGFRELDEICQGRIGRHKPEAVAPTSMWCLGEDALNLTTFTKHKTGVAGLRSEELPPRMSHTRAAFEPLIIMEDDVADPSDCFSRTIEILLKHGPIPSKGSLTTSLLRCHVLSMYCSSATVSCNTSSRRVKEAILRAIRPIRMYSSSCRETYSGV